MPSGKRARQQRQQAAPPPVRSKGAPGLGARQASPRVLAIAGGVVLLVVIAIVLAVVLSGGKSPNNGSNDGPTISIADGTPTVGSSNQSTNPNVLLGAADVERLLKGIPQTGFRLGKATAPVTLVEYIDLQCPDCDAFETTEFAPLVEKYVRPGKLKIMIQPWSILDRTPDIHDSDRGQRATIAAAAQNKAFNFAQVLYDNQGTEGTGWLNDAMISNIAASVDGLKPYQLATDASSAETRSIVRNITDFANSHPAQMTGTPTLYLGKGLATPQWFFTGVPDLGTLEAAIDARLK